MLEDDDYEDTQKPKRPSQEEEEAPLKESEKKEELVNYKRGYTKEEKNMIEEWLKKNTPTKE